MGIEESEEDLVAEVVVVVEDLETEEALEVVLEVAGAVEDLEIEEEAEAEAEEGPVEVVAVEEVEVAEVVWVVARKYLLSPIAIQECLLHEERKML